MSQLPNPFPGLRPFKTEETHLFFGREGQIDEVLLKMEKHHFVAILGTSGSGKSSFMYCGLIPSLHGGFMTEVGSNWRIVVTRPGLSPISNLAEALTASNLSGSQDENMQVRKNVTTAILQGSSLGLVEVVGQSRTAPDENVLILVDQFEELFRFGRDAQDEAQANETLAFVKLLTQAVEQREQPIYVVMTMRSDYIGDCAQFPAFTKMINDSHYLIPQMTRDQKRSAILGPVAVGGGEISSRLTQRLLNDLGDNPDQLPILQHALMRTWGFWESQRLISEGEAMDLYHYEAIGTMAEALSMHANEAFEELEQEDQKLAERIFKCLTEKGADGRGIRRPTRLRDIATIVEAPIEDVLAVIDRFRMGGRTLLMPDMNAVVGANTVIDISHESLMRIWSRLREWVQEESDSVKMYLRLAEAAEMYQRGTSGLWRPPDLQVAMAWQEKQRPNEAWGLRHHPAYERTMVFLENSTLAYEEEQRGKERLQKKRLQRTRLFALILGLATIISASFLVYARLQNQQAVANLQLAEEQKSLAEKNKDEAESERKKAIEKAEEAESAKKRAEEALAQAEVARQVAEASKREAIKSAEEARTQKELAEKSAEKAKLAQTEAELQKGLAEGSAKLAKEQQSRAEKEEEAAKQLRFKALAQTMAVKSLQLSDTVQKALVARQAYRFNKEYNSDQLDPDVYTGLYYAQKTLQGEDFNLMAENSHKNAAVQGMVFLPSGILMTTGSDGMVKSWTDGKAIDIAATPHINKSMALNKAGSMLAVGTDNGHVALIDLQNMPAKERQLSMHPGGVWQAVFTDQGVISIGADKTVRFANFDGVSEAVLALPSDAPKAIAWLKEGNKILVATYTGKVLMMDCLPNAQPTLLFEQAKEISSAMAIDPTGELLAVGFQSGKVAIWSLSQKQRKHTLTGHNAQVSQVIFSGDGSFLATCSFDRTARLWKQGQYNAPVAIFNDHNSWAWSVAFSPKNERLMVGCLDGTIRSYALQMEEMAQFLEKNVNQELSKEEWEQFVGKDIPYQQ